MRTRGEKIRRLVCAEHCQFYKPWSAEVEPCAAYHWLANDGSGGDRVLDALEKLRGKRQVAREELDGALHRSVCARCTHYPDGCRYRSKQKTGAATPCGGLTVLRTLLDQNRVTLEDLYHVATTRAGTA